MKYRYEFEEINDVLVIHTFDEEEELPTYPIRVAELNELSQDDERISEWIRHLISKTWMTHDGLYQLAREIRKYHPDNKIEWRETFAFIERSRYLNQKEKESSLNEEKDKETPLGAFDRVLASIELRKGLRSESGFDEMIKRQVDAKLKEEGIKE